ncbi:hypothetical protein FOL46_005385 [Perkinsus olseni]|nr:hypothetical protein FOL46_005385 [Perkinsus olseni]
MLSVIVVAIGGPSLQPGKYCAFPVKLRVFATCLFFEYHSPTSAYLVYNYFDRHFFAMGYDNVKLEDDKIIMTRYGHTEGPELYPYFDVGFDLKVSSDKPDVVRVVAKNDKYTYSLTKGCKPPPGVKAASCSNPIHDEQRQRRRSSLEERQPDGTYQAVPGPNNHAFILGANSTTHYGYTSHFDSKRNTFWYYSYDSSTKGVTRLTLLNNARCW